jgi:predicted dehydrogenase
LIYAAPANYDEINAEVCLMERIKVGIIGSGFSAAAHVEALNRIPSVEVVAVASSSLIKSSEFAAKMNIPKSYGTVEELIADPHVHAVHNCTPNYLHYEINKKVLLAQKHLLSEKPLAINSEQSRELAELANRTNVVSGVCFNYRHYPMVCQAKEMLTSGEVGKPNLVYGGYMQDWLSLDTDYSWRLEEDKNGPSRAIADIGSHWCDTVQYLLNKKIVEVFADLETVYPIRRKPITSLPSFQSSAAVERENINIRTEDYGSVLVHFEDGIKGVFTVSQVSTGRKNRLHVEISAGKTQPSMDRTKEQAQ